MYYVRSKTYNCLCAILKTHAEAEAEKKIIDSRGIYGKTEIVFVNEHAGQEARPCPD